MKNYCLYNKDTYIPNIYYKCWEYIPVSFGDPIPNNIIHICDKILIVGLVFPIESLIGLKEICQSLIIVINNELMFQKIEKWSYSNLVLYNPNKSLLEIIRRLFA